MDIEMTNGDPIPHFELVDEAPDYDAMLERIGMVANLTEEELAQIESLQ